MYRLTVDLQFRQILMTVVSQFSERKHIDEEEMGWCLDLRHMILKMEWEGRSITNSHELAHVIEQYSNEQLTSRFCIFGISAFCITMSRDLKKKLIKVIQTELTDALYRELIARDSFIHDSEQTDHLRALLETNQQMEETLREVRSVLEERDEQILEQQNQLGNFQQENEGLQLRLGESLEKVNDLVLELNRVKERLSLIPELQQSLKLLRQEVYELKSSSRRYDIDPIDAISDGSSLSD